MFSHLDFSGSVPPAGLARCDVEPGPTSLATAPSLRGLLGLASGPPGSLAPLVLTPRELRHRRPRLHVHQLRREHHGGRDAVVLEPVVVAVHRVVAVDILGTFVNLEVAAVVPAAQQVHLERRELVSEQPQQDGALRRDVLPLLAQRVIGEELDDAAVELGGHAVLSQRRLQGVFHQASVRAVHRSLLDDDGLPGHRPGPGVVAHLVLGHGGFHIFFGEVGEHHSRVTADVLGELVEAVPLLVLGSLTERHLHHLVGAHEETGGIGERSLQLLEGVVAEVGASEDEHGLVLLESLADLFDEAALPLPVLLLGLRERDDLIAPGFRHLFSPSPPRSSVRGGIKAAAAALESGGPMDAGRSRRPARRMLSRRRFRSVRALLAP
mmetsp:Transcript_11986/g.51600  ORF Transcript_11986/g.51600 Transcript_11986/m.51600 type:complete len:381 (+) Transcript_11986:1442-2584(+)